MSIFEGLGRALRWLREGRGKRQYQVAEAAGITKPMLSAYETGRQKPSLETLEKILEAMGADLAELHGALDIVNGRPSSASRASGRPGIPYGAWSGQEGSDRAADVQGVLGGSGSLPGSREEALTDMVRGFHELIRHLHQALSRLEERGEGKGKDGGEGVQP